MSKSFKMAMWCIFGATAIAIVFFVLTMSFCSKAETRRLFPLIVAKTIGDSWPDTDVWAIEDFKTEMTPEEVDPSWIVTWSHEGEVTRDQAAIVVPQGEEVIEIFVQRKANENAFRIHGDEIEEVDPKSISARVERGELLVLGFVELQ